MLKTVHYGPHSFKPWCEGTGYLDRSAKSLKSYRSREPRSIWQSLNPKSEDLGEYDLYICKHCFLYTSKQQDIAKHEGLCRYRDGHPGKIVFEDSKYRFYEVRVPPAPHPPQTTSRSRSSSPSDPDGDSTNGASNPDLCYTPGGTEFNSIKLYLQCLSLFGHLFLETKSICFCVDAFIFYVAIDKSDGMCAGFFSKELHSWHDYNLACIVIFPPWQRHGLGQRLIAFSYVLSRHAAKLGSPEKPLSSHGQLAYYRYWRRKFLQYASMKKPRNATSLKLTLDAVAKETGIEPADLHEALNAANAITGNVISFKKVLDTTNKPK